MSKNLHNPKSLNDTKEFNHPAYINVPHFVLKEEKLDWFNKFLFSLFWSFSVSGKKIKMSNEYLSDLFGVSDKHIQNRIKVLEDLGFIKRSVVKYKRIIEVCNLVLNPIINEDNCADLILTPSTVGASTIIELTPSTGGASTIIEPKSSAVSVQLLNSHQAQLVLAPTAVGAYTKAILKKDITPISPEGEVEEIKVVFSLTQILKDNPHNIPREMLDDWLQVRKVKKVPMSATAWKGTNSVMNKLAEAGLNPIECFESMVASGWQGMKVSYFDKEIAALKPKQPLKYVTKENRPAEYEKIATREKDAERRKKEEIEGSKIYQDVVRQSKTIAQRMSEHKDKLDETGLSPQQLHDEIVRR